ncbi:MAG: XdhC family protein [Gemmatimonadaceae bacterium]
MPADSIFSECARLAAGAGAGAGALASVARQRGSLPMSATAKMLVTVTGARHGTVGGGCLEAEIIERALQVAERRRPEISEHTLNAEIAGDYGLTCGGTAVMFIEPVFVDPVLAAVYGECAALLARGGRGVMATSADWSDGVRKALVHSWRTAGSPDSALLEAAAAVDPARETPELVGDLLLDPVVGRPRLVVFGGGHVGARVAEAASFAGWRVTVVDDRADFADPARLPFAERTVVCDYHDLPSALAIDGSTYVVVATRGHQHDALVVEQVARGSTRYLGMLGSRRKVELTWRLLEKAGAPRERLETVHAPVGLSIGADTPEEIAISVVAEMIAVRREGSRRRGGRAKGSEVNEVSEVSDSHSHQSSDSHHSHHSRGGGEHGS